MSFDTLVFTCQLFLLAFSVGLFLRSSKEWHQTYFQLGGQHDPVVCGIWVFSLVLLCTVLYFLPIQLTITWR